MDDPIAILKIESPANPRVRRIVALIERASARREQGVAVIEGEHLLLAWLEHRPEQVQEIYFRSEAGVTAPGVGVSDQHPADRFMLGDAVFKRLSSLENSPGPIALVSLPRSEMAGEIREDAVFLDRLQDPGNAGTILRSAAAFGVRSIFASPGCVDLWSPKVLRAAMGAHPVLNIIQGVTLEALTASAVVPLCATSSHAGQSISDADLSGPRVWLFGQEGGGLDASVLDGTRLLPLKIDQNPAIESLNVGVAASICLYEQYRQRQRHSYG